MSKDQVDLSVIIPTWDRADMVMDAVRSILSQDYPGVIEIIVVDDGSEDETVPRLHELDSRRTNPKRRLLVIEKQHSGITDSIRVGFLASKGQYISYLSSDDSWDADRAGLLLEASRRETGLVLIYTNWRFVDQSMRLLRANGMGDLPVFEWDRKHGRSLYGAFASYWIPGGVSIFPRSLLDGDFILPADLPSEDYWFGLCAMLRGKIKFLDNCSIAIRHHSRQHFPNFPYMSETANVWIRQEINYCNHAEKLLRTHAPNEKKLLEYFSVRKRLFESRRLRSQGKIVQSAFRTFACLGDVLCFRALGFLFLSNLLFSVDPELIRPAKAFKDRLEQHLAISGRRKKTSNRSKR